MLPAKHFALNALVGILAIGLSACSDNDDSMANLSEDMQQNVVVNFATKVNDMDFRCGDTYQIGSGQSKALQINDLRYYLSDISLKSATGSETKLALVNDNAWQNDEIALMDFRENCLLNSGIDNGLNASLSNTQVIANASVEALNTASELCFTVGLPDHVNHADPDSADSPLNVTGMNWIWLVGHKHFRFDAIADPQNSATAFNFHLGNTGCSNALGEDGSNDFGQAPVSSCLAVNTPRFCVAFNDLTTQDIVLNVDKIFAETDIMYNTPDTPKVCMSGANDPECQSIMSRMNLDFIFNDGLTEQTYSARSDIDLFVAE